MTKKQKDKEKLKLFSSLDWFKTNRLLASETGFCALTVRAWRYRLGHPKARWKRLPEWDEHHRRADWAKVDWKLQDIILSKQLGVSRERVRQVRRRLEKPDPDTKKKRT